MKLLLTHAIQERRLIRLIYDNKARITAQPHVLGVALNQCEAVLCWQVLPPSSEAEPWRLLHLDKISELRMLDEHFELPSDNRQPPLDQFGTTYVIPSGPEISIRDSV